jgi:hypothetical protein
MGHQANSNLDVLQHQQARVACFVVPAPAPLRRPLDTCVAERGLGRVLTSGPRLLAKEHSRRGRPVWDMWDKSMINISAIIKSINR